MCTTLTAKLHPAHALRGKFVPVPVQFDLCKEEGVYGQVHGGFYEALCYPVLEPRESIFQAICRALLAELTGNKKLYITGHSLGKGTIHWASALALVCLS